MQVDLTVQHPLNWAQLLNQCPSTGYTSAHLLVEDGEPISTETWQQWFEKWLMVLEPDISPIQAYALTLRLTNDAEIRSLNALYRQQDRPTDVLAFAALEAPSTPTYSWCAHPVELGDIVISVDTALRQAQAGDRSLSQELAWLASHGLLHLLGWDHPDSDSLDLMLTQQSQLLVAIGVISPDSAESLRFC
jgi:probable rRNA maturation factor